jgi:AcrR family transcriptional regulator
MARKRQEELVENRKRQILNAARGVFIGRGYDKATTAEIAMTAGVSEGTIYNYYHSKRDLLISLSSDFLKSQHLLSLMNNDCKPGDQVFFHELVRERIDKGFENVKLMMLLLNEVQRDPELKKLYMEQIVEPVHQALDRFLKTGIDQKTFQDMDIAVSQRVLIGALLGTSILFYLEGDSGPLNRASRQDIAEEVTRLFLHGIYRK